MPDKCANRPASPRAGGSARTVFDLNFVARIFRLSPARGERIKVRGSTACRRYLENDPSPSPLPSEGRGDLGARSHCSGWTRNAERLIFRVEYNARNTPGYRLLLRDVSQTGDVAYLPADHRSETMRSGGDCAEARKSPSAIRLSLFTSFPSRERISFGGFGFDNCVISRGRSPTQSCATLLSCSKRNARASFAHLLWPHRGASPAADSGVEISIDCFLSRRRCYGRYE